MPSFDFSPYAAVLLDFDGTLCHEEHVLPGAPELLARLESSQIPYAVLSNTTSSPQSIGRQLRRLGMPISDPHIYTAAGAAAGYVMEKYPGVPRVFNLATDGITELLDGKVHWTESDHEPCDALICGAPANRFATADRQQTAMRLLRAGAELVAICADRVYPSARGIEIGVGGLAQMLSYAANVPILFAGKPNKLFFDHLCQRLGVVANQCILIGDNLESDVAGAAALGMKTILPLTGVTRIEDLDRLPAAARPNWMVRDLKELL